MSNVISKGIEIFIGFSSGVLIGGAYVAILIFLGVIPRILQLVRYRRLVLYIILGLLFGVFTGTYLTFTERPMNVSPIVSLLWGSFHGIFNGMMAAALVEVLNVFPLLSKRLGLDDRLLILLTAMIGGKVLGSLFQVFFL